MKDTRMAGYEDQLQREHDLVDSAQPSNYGPSKIYRLLPADDGKKFDNRIIIRLHRPAIACPEIFGKFYPEDMWDFKAAIVGHWLNDEAADKSVFVYCPEGTARYYKKWLGKDFEAPPCEVNCKENNIKASTRYIYQVFDFQKLIGERDLDEGEERPRIQILSSPETIYKQLWSKLKAGYEFWDNFVTRITKDTTKGVRYSEYTVEIEPNTPEELEIPDLKTYLEDPKNWINPIDAEAVRLSLDRPNRSSGNEEAGAAKSSSGAGVGSNESKVTSGSGSGATEKRKRVRW